MPHPEVIDMPFDKAAAVRVFAGAMILAGEAAQQYAGHYSAEFGSHNGNPALWTSHVRVGVPDEQGEAAHFMLAGMGYNTHNRLTASCADLPGADMASGAYLVTREALPAVARTGERLQGDPPPWSVRGVGDQATEDLEIHTAGLLPLTARLWVAIGHGIGRMVENGQPAQAYVAQRFDSATATATLYGQPTSKHQSELSFVCTRPEQVVTRFELTMRPAVSKGDEPTYAHARCSVSAVYPPYGDRPRQLFRDTIVQTGTELEVVRTRMTLREEFDESRLDLDGEPKREIVRDVDELGRARASGETIYQFALAATYGSALPRRVQEWDA